MRPPLTLRSGMRESSSAPKTAWLEPELREGRSPGLDERPSPVSVLGTRFMATRFSTRSSDSSATSPLGSSGSPASLRSFAAISAISSGA